MRVVDSFDAIRPIMSRFSMLAPLDKDGIRLQVHRVSLTGPLLARQQGSTACSASPELRLRAISACRDRRRPGTPQTAHACARHSRSPSPRVGRPATQRRPSLVALFCRMLAALSLGASTCSNARAGFRVVHAGGPDTGQSQRMFRESGGWHGVDGGLCPGTYKVGSTALESQGDLPCVRRVQPGRGAAAAVRGGHATAAAGQTALGGRPRRRARPRRHPQGAICPADPYPQTPACKPGRPARARAARHPSMAGRLQGPVGAGQGRARMGARGAARQTGTAV